MTSNHFSNIPDKLIHHITSFLPETSFPKLLFVDKKWHDLIWRPKDEKATNQYKNYRIFLVDSLLKVNADQNLSKDKAAKNQCKNYAIAFFDLLLKANASQNPSELLTLHPLDLLMVRTNTKRDELIRSEQSNYSILNMLKNEINPVIKNMSIAPKPVLMKFCREIESNKEEEKDHEFAIATSLHLSKMQNVLNQLLESKAPIPPANIAPVLPVVAPAILFSAPADDAPMAQAGVDPNFDFSVFRFAYTVLIISILLGVSMYQIFDLQKSQR